MKWYQLDVEKVEQKLHVSAAKGLTEKQVQERRKNSAGIFLKHRNRRRDG